MSQFYNNTISTHSTATKEPIVLNDGDTAWLLVSAAMVMFMIPGLGYFYSGLARHKNALSLIFLSMISLAIVTIQWFILGYSLAFGESGNPFIGNLNHVFFIGLFGSEQYVYPDYPSVPGAGFIVFQGMFAAITPALAFGSAAERTRIIPCMLFIFIWSTLVYDVLAYWTWGPSGWLKMLGSLYFAGGTPVHIASGAAGLAYALVAGKRHGYGKETFKPHNLSSVFMGTAFLWFGWNAFNGGSALAANAHAAMAVVNTNIAAAAGALTWVFLDYRHEQKFSAFAFCSGAVAGLVCITPGAGFVFPWAAFVFGLLGSCFCNLFVSFKHHYGFDDALDVFGVHGIGGITGNLLTGLFASSEALKFEGPGIAGGWIDGNWIQLGYQLAGTLSGFMWSFTITFLILYIMNKIPRLGLRLEKEKEIVGVDIAQMGESAYDYKESAVLINLTGDSANIQMKDLSNFNSEETLENVASAGQ